MNRTILVNEWVRRKLEIDDPSDLFRVLHQTGSYIAGTSLRQVLKTGGSEGLVKIFASKEGAQFLVSLLHTYKHKVKTMLNIDTLETVRTGVALSIQSRRLEILVCKQPLEAIVNQDAEVYFDGKAVVDTLSKEPDTKEEWYKQLTDQICDFIQATYMRPEYLGAVLAYHCRIATCLFEFTLQELVQNLSKIKKLFLPEFFQENVMLLIENAIAELFNEFERDGDQEMMDLMTLYCTENLGKTRAQLASGDVPVDSQVHQKKLLINGLKFQAEFKNKIDSMRMREDPARSLHNLEFFTRPSADAVEELEYDEKKEQKCLDLESFSYYDINAYLNGDAVMAYDEDGAEEKDSMIEAVPPEVARKRLVFFVASDPSLRIIKPYCYNVEQLEKDLSTRIYSDTCTASGGYQQIDRGFSNPLFKLAFESNVFVRLSKLLKALYETQSQAFLLIPTDEVAPRTASLSTYLYQLGVSGDHCQAGTDKRVYRIVVCGKGTDKCYPLRGDIRFRPDTHSRVNDTDYNAHLRRYKEDIKAAREEQNILALPAEED